MVVPGGVSTQRRTSALARGVNKDRKARVSLPQEMDTNLQQEISEDAGNGDSDANDNDEGKSSGPSRESAMMRMIALDRWTLAVCAMDPVRFTPVDARKCHKRIVIATETNWMCSVFAGAAV